jgi:excisionase family DNA binding protein
MTTTQFRRWLQERIDEMAEIAENHPPDETDRWLADYGGMLVRQASKIASELGLIDAYERCRVRFAFPADAHALLSYCLSCVPEEEMPTQATHPYLTPPQVAKTLRVRRDKVLGWIRSGQLRASNVAARRGGRPRYRIEWSDLHAFIQNRLIQLPPPPRRSRPTPEGVTEYF